MKIALVAAFGIIFILFAASARAENWFLMAPSKNAMKNQSLFIDWAPKRSRPYHSYRTGRFLPEMTVRLRGQRSSRNGVRMEV
jgi:hypothetical protein